MKNTADLIRTSKAEKRIGLRELSEKCGVVYSYLSDIQHGKKKTMNMILYRKICKALCIPKEEMIKAILKDIEDEFNTAWNKKGDK